MAKTREKSATYAAIGPEADRADSRSDSANLLRPGIGTRISAAADAAGSRKNAAAIMGVSTDALQRYIREENQPTFDAVARLCMATGFRLDWVATGAAPERLGESGSVTESQLSSQPLNERLLTIALELGDEAAKAAGWAPRADVARVVREAYLALVDGATPAELWQDLQDALRTEPRREVSSGSKEEARDVRRRRGGVGR